MEATLKEKQLFILHQPVSHFLRCEYCLRTAATCTEVTQDVAVNVGNFYSFKTTHVRLVLPVSYALAN